MGRRSRYALGRFVAGIYILIAAAATVCMVWSCDSPEAVIMVGLLTLLTFAGLGLVLIVVVGTIAEWFSEMFRAVRHTRRAVFRVVARGTRRAQAPDNRQP